MAGDYQHAVNALNQPKPATPPYHTGDIVLVEGVVNRDGVIEFWPPPVTNPYSGGSPLQHPPTVQMATKLKIVEVRPQPQPWKPKVGDEVASALSGNAVGSIRAIAGEEAWIEDRATHHGSKYIRSTFKLSELRPVAEQRALRAGDPVVTQMPSIIAIDRDEAWVLLANGHHGTWPLADLILRP